MECPFVNRVERKDNDGGMAIKLEPTRNIASVVSEMPTKATLLRLITYDCGDAFDASKFDPIKNKEFIKPHGGLWASPVDSEWGWKHWCKAESFLDLETFFEFSFNGQVFLIDSFDDLMLMPWLIYPGYSSIRWPDYEAMASLGVDAIHLTDRGQQETRWTSPGLYGWDCESVLIMNPEGIN